MRRRNLPTTSHLVTGRIRLEAVGGRAVAETRINVKDTLAKLEKLCPNKNRFEFNTRGDADRHSTFATADGSLTITGNYPHARLLYEVARAKKAGLTTVRISRKALQKPPSEALHDHLAESWERLSRSTGPDGIKNAILDSKTEGDDTLRVYYPQTDKLAASAVPEFINDMRNELGRKVELVKAPSNISPRTFAHCSEKPGLLTLKLVKRGGEVSGVKFVTPGGRFNEMYGWDSHFIILGLLMQGRIDQALEMFENLIYQLKHYQRILNATRSWSLNRSQAPFLTATITAIFHAMEGRKDRIDWLKRAVRWAVWEYVNVWYTYDRTVLNGLQHYRGFNSGMPPEVESTQFDWRLIPFAKSIGKSLEEVKRAIRSGELTHRELMLFFFHDVAVRESGHDTTLRWGWESRCAAFAGADLNALLLRYEVDLAYLIGTYLGGSLDLGSYGSTNAKFWHARARKRACLMKEHLLHPNGVFFDYDTERRELKEFYSPVGFWTPWATENGNFAELFGHSVSPRQIVDTLREHLDCGGPLFASSKECVFREDPDREHPRQWDWPAVWPNHQIMALLTCQMFGFDTDAREMAEGGLELMVRGFAQYSVFTEKYNGLDWTPFVNAEYGTVGADAEYGDFDGFGWTNTWYELVYRITGGRIPGLRLAA